VTSLTTKKADGAAGVSVELPDEIFGIEPNVAVMHQVVTAQLAAKRSGTHNTKTRAEVQGGGAKPWRQKGTGRARQGSIRSPQWRGGGIAHGPKPRDYRTELPKKQRRAALAAALSQKAGENAVTVIDALKFEAPKTKEMAEVLKRLGLGDKRTLLVIGDADPNVVRSCRNLRNLHTTLAHQINPYELLQSEAVLVTAPGLAAMKEIFAR